MLKLDLIKKPFYISIYPWNGLFDFLIKKNKYLLTIIPHEKSLFASRFLINLNAKLPELGLEKLGGFIRKQK